jgi:cell division protein FtsB
MNTNKRFFTILYLGTIAIFLVYMLFISAHNLSKHIELSKKIKKLDESIIQTKNQINNKFTYTELKNNPKLLEQYAREQMNMQKKDEDVFVIVYQSK